MTIEQVGTVDVLATRIYPLDAAMRHDPDATTVYVPAGTYPVFQEHDTYYWVMTGRINGRGFRKLGDGMFSINQGDSPAGPEVKFPSATFGAEQFREFLAEPVCREGDPGQRLRFHLPLAEPKERAA